MNEEICCITNKEKTSKNEYENDDSDFLQALYSVYKKLGQFFFHIFSLILNKDASVLSKNINTQTS